MPKFSQHSEDELATANPKLQAIFNELIKLIDFTVLDAARTTEEQRKNVLKGVSKTMDSKHVVSEHRSTAAAVDAALWPQLWNDTRQALMSQWEVDQLFFAGLVVGFARARGVKLRYGGDWDGNFRNLGTGFRDLPHFELVDE